MSNMNWTWCLNPRFAAVGSGASTAALAPRNFSLLGTTIDAGPTDSGRHMLYFYPIISALPPHHWLRRSHQSVHSPRSLAISTRAYAHAPRPRLIGSSNDDTDLTAFGLMASFGYIQDELDLYLDLA
ncbi:hypothetical protein BDZ89DRAFT_1141986 [Hymenopellis radicata]|nr:hypothetical protein BDZ89DRAFT_1141986 [Hymenopellis radicata]